MKFGRYLAENQTPEWKRAYIDYRICKKKIKVVARRLGQDGSGPGDGGADSSGSKGKERASDSSDNDLDHGPSAPPKSTRSPSTIKGPRSGSGSVMGTPGSGAASNRAGAANRTPKTYGSMGSSPQPIQRVQSNPPPLDLGESSYGESSNMPKRTGTVNFSERPEERDAGMPRLSEQDEHGQENGESTKSPRSSDDTGKGLVQSPSKPGRGTANEDLENGDGTPMSPRTIKSPRFALSGITTRSPMSSRDPKSPAMQSTRRSMRGSFSMPSPMISKTPSLRHAATFEELYDQLEDDEKDFFDFLDHELEKVEEFFKNRQNEAVRRAHDLRDQLRELAEHRKLYHELYPEGIPEWEARVERVIPGIAPHSAKPWKSMTQKVQEILSTGTGTPAGDSEHSKQPVGVLGGGTAASPAGHEALKAAMIADKDHVTYNPERYQKYKAELRKATLEFYRQLELIKNYRIMNLTGFRKALKKFEKTTNIHCLEMYTDERISKETFAKGEMIDNLLKEIEDLYATHFEHGDGKKAKDKLRRQDDIGRSHYTSTFRSGLYLGIGLFAAIQALVEAVKPETHVLIPQWDGLLQVYAGIFLPVIFACLFELNLDAYVSARINYEFVMELTRPTLDYRSYLEMPAFLFMTLSICMTFSYYRIGADHVAPTTWPAAWLVFLVVFWLNPLPIFRRASRYWFLRVLFRVFTPGISRVEFIAFFIADELNSLVYSIQTVMFLSCAYGKEWPAPVYSYCPSGASWPYILVSIIPGLIRFIQCLKRYHDSKLRIHLINAGKYASTMIFYIFFVLWRSRGSRIDDGVFIAWVIVGTIYSTYTCAWDFIVDWSLFRPDSALLRPELGYQNRWVYYFAMVTNALVRSVWIWYIPDQARHTRLRSFFFSLAEMLRRWQWNFFRVETEHLGNADAYRVTREIPLPYRRVENDWEDDNNNRTAQSPLSVHLDRIRKGFGGSSNTVNVNADGKSGAEGADTALKRQITRRGYEARQPGEELRSRTRTTADNDV